MSHPMGPVAYTPPRRSSSIPWWIIAIMFIFLCLCGLSFVFSYLLVAGSGSTLFGYAARPQASKTGLSFIKPIQSHSAVAVTNDFMESLKDQNYLQAYSHFDTTILVLITPLDFERQMKQADSCYGTIDHYQMAKQTEVQGVMTINYTITRRKFGSYPFQFQLVQGANGDWSITGYGQDEALSPPGTSACV